MPAEPQLTRWLKFITIAVALGALIEISSATGKFYSFTPGWIVFIVVFGGFGLGLGTVAYLLRRTGDLTQFLLGSVGTAIAEKQLQRLDTIPAMARNGSAMALQWLLGT